MVAEWRRLRHACIIRRVKTKTVKDKKPPGRKPSPDRRRGPVHVMIDRRISEGLRRIGDGNLSAGVALVIQKAKKRRHGSTSPLPDVRAVLGLARKRSDDAKRPVGNPILGTEKRLRTTIQLFPEEAELLWHFGDEVVSQGIERAALFTGDVTL